MQPIAEGFARYLDEKMPEAHEVTVEDVARFHGGASRETYRVTARWLEGGEAHTRGMVIRRDPASSLIETERATEFLAYEAFHGTDVPVPKPLFLETEKNPWLGQPFFVMEEIAGCESGFAAFQRKPYSELIDRIGEAKWTILGRISAADPARLGLTGKLASPAPADCWRRELDHWTKVIDEDQLAPQPIIRAAMRWMRRNPPPAPDRIHVVHGDYRTGNFLFDATGEIRGILDWEMCHLGDPLEDLAWALTPLWGWPNADRPGKLIARARAIEIWEAASGLRADPDALRWWEVFACVKGLGIWISSSHEFQTGKNQDPIMIIPAWYCTEVHNRILVDLIPREEARA
jgi:aminoglycoside phosphotransferase (APT) family kinase protein